MKNFQSRIAVCNQKGGVGKSGGTHMRIIIVRHGDPNYELDTLTKTGWREAELAAEYLAKLRIKAFYLSFQM